MRRIAPLFLVIVAAAVAAGCSSDSSTSAPSSTTAAPGGAAVVSVADYCQAAQELQAIPQSTAPDAQKAQQAQAALARITAAAPENIKAAYGVVFKVGSGDEVQAKKTIDDYEAANCAPASAGSTPSSAK